MHRIFVPAWCALMAAGCGTTLQSGLGEAETNEMVMVLAKAGLEAHKVREGSGPDASWAIEIARDRLPDAWRVLSEAGLPRPRHAGFREVYSERALVPGKMEEQALYLSALQEEIACTLESVEGVMTARVHVQQPNSNRWSRDQPEKTTASVLITYQPGREGEAPLSEQGVREVVGNAVSGLDRRSVAVVFTPRRRVEPPPRIRETPGIRLSSLRPVAIVLAALAIGLALVIAVRKWMPRKALGPRGRTVP